MNPNPHTDRGASRSPNSASTRAPGPDAAATSAKLTATAAAAVIRRRCRHGRYRGLSDETANRLINHLVGIASGVSPRHPDELAEATALAHRILDDDHPDHTALWRRLTAPLNAAHTPRPVP